MNKPQAILIVSYKLGTSNGVGGRRWLNYGLELIRQGYDVFFLTYQQNIPEELLEHKHRIVILKGNYPEILNKVPITLLEKLHYRFYLFLLTKWNKGNTFDATIRTKKQFISSVVKIIKEKKISHLIISGAPFSLLFFGTIIKKKLPFVKLISDYRDAWTNGIGYGIPNLPKHKLEYELECEKAVLGTSDTIIVASEDIAYSLKQIATNINPVVLSNFINTISFEQPFSVKKSKNANDICITHIGSVNQGTEYYWQHFFQKIDIFNKQNVNKIKCRFIGGQLSTIKNYLLDHQFSFVEFFPHMTTIQMESYMRESDFFVLFKNDKFPNSFPTKFFDYIYFRKPLLCYSLNGSVTIEIEQNEIGFVFDNETTQQQFDNGIIQLFCEKKFNDKYNYEKFSLPNLTSVLIEDVLN